MAEVHDHDHQHSPEPRKNRSLLKATAGSLIIAATEFWFGSWALRADTVHNIGDAASYALGHESNAQRHAGTGRINKIRRTAAGIICLGAAWVGAEAVHDIATGQTEKAGDYAEWVAGSAFVGNLAIQRALKPHGEVSGGHSDGLRHAISDVVVSAGTTGAVFLSRHGWVPADAWGAAVGSAVTVAMNFPTEHRMSHGHQH